MERKDNLQLGLKSGISDERRSTEMDKNKAIQDNQRNREDIVIQLAEKDDERELETTCASCVSTEGIALPSRNQEDTSFNCIMRDESVCFREGNEMEPEEDRILFEQCKSKKSNIMQWTFEHADNEPGLMAVQEVHDDSGNSGKIKEVQQSDGCNSNQNKLKEIQEPPLSPEKDHHHNNAEPSIAPLAGIQDDVEHGAVAIQGEYKSKINEGIKEIQLVLDPRQAVLSGKQSQQVMFAPRQAILMEKQWHTFKAVPEEEEMEKSILDRNEWVKRKLEEEGKEGKKLEEKEGEIRKLVEELERRIEEEDGHAKLECESERVKIKEKEREKRRMQQQREMERKMMEGETELPRINSEVEKDEQEVEDRRTLEREALERPSVETRERAEIIAMEMVTAEREQRKLEMAQEKEEKFLAKDGYLSDMWAPDLQFQSFDASISNCQRFSESFDVPAEKLGGSEFNSFTRCKARMERHQRTIERMAIALAEKNMRDIIAQREQAERNRLAETLDADVRRWSNGKEGNLRALLSTLQYILGPESGWQPIPLTDVITAAAVKKAYRKAMLYVHPDKLQQRSANIQQKYVCEKVFDLLKEAWNRFNSEEWNMGEDDNPATTVQHRSNSLGGNVVRCTNEENLCIERSEVFMPSKNMNDISNVRAVASFHSAAATRLRAGTGTAGTGATFVAGGSSPFSLQDWIAPSNMSSRLYLNWKPMSKSFFDEKDMMSNTGMSPNLQSPSPP
ncbi:hypothetical protein Taro_036290 [Colocasia esculenta]|uniref:J domain-containing protein n=1 Tax=Colocasia esculenta TaxID=4460 RepID=A0A843WL83_COLES|nr:hypothetical protein [Colocasia esculenta]